MSLTNLKKISALIISCVMLLSCEEMAESLTPKSTFSEPFHHRTQDLSQLLGERFEILDDEHSSTSYQIEFDEHTKLNRITNESDNELVFNGLVSKHRGLYYFNTKRPDSTFWVSAIKIDDSTIQGFNTVWYQMLLWDLNFRDHLSDIDGFASFDSTNNHIMLSPNNKELRDFYSSIIDSLPKQVFRVK